MTLLAAIVMALQAPPVSRSGYRALSAFRDENERAIRAPKPDEVIAAFAVAGAAALVGTAFESYGDLLKPQHDDGCGSGCGGGSGGGGCGA